MGGEDSGPFCLRVFDTSSYGSKYGDSAGAHGGRTAFLRWMWLSATVTGVSQRRQVPPELRLRLLRPHRGLNDRLKLPEIAELNLAAVERKIVFENNVQRGAAWELCFWSASQEHSG